jgi:hypothetical protein
LLVRQTREFRDSEVNHLLNARFVNEPRHVRTQSPWHRRHK